MAATSGQYLFLIGDPQRLFAEGLQALLHMQGFARQTFVAENADEVLHMSSIYDVEIFFINTLLFHYAPESFIHQVQNSRPSSHILLYSDFFDPRYVKKFEGWGAHAYLSKQLSFEVVKEALKAVVSGAHYLPTKYQASQAPPLSGSKTKGSQRSLTLREEEVLKLISEGLNTRTISKRLGISVKTAESHRKNIMNKLQMHSIAELTKFAVRHGLSQL